MRAAGGEGDVAGPDREAAGRTPEFAGRDREAAGRTPEFAGRDRDASGRPRNARPRDELGRPLPRDAGGEAPPPDEPALAPDAALDLAQQLIDSGRAFRAHEVLEASWKAAPPGERDLWQGLAQIAVGLTHAQRGNARGAVELLRRGGRRVAGYAGGPAPYDIAADEVARFAADLAGRIERDGLGPATTEELRVTLRGGGH
jgi:uncharacterized protein